MYNQNSIIEVSGPTLPTFIKPYPFSSPSESSADEANLPPTRVVIQLAGQRPSTSPIANAIIHAVEDQPDFEEQSKNTWQKMFRNRPTTSYIPSMKPETQSIGSKMPTRSKIEIKGTPIEAKVSINAHSLNKSISEVQLQGKSRLNSSFSRQDLNVWIKRGKVDRILKWNATLNPNSASQKLLNIKDKRTQLKRPVSSYLSKRITWAKSTPYLTPFHSLSISEESSTGSNNTQKLKNIGASTCKAEMAAKFPHLRIISTPSSTVISEQSIFEDSEVSSESIQSPIRPKWSKIRPASHKLQINLPDSITPFNIPSPQQSPQIQLNSTLPVKPNRPQTAAAVRSLPISTKAANNEQSSSSFINQSVPKLNLAPFSNPVRGSKVIQTGEYGVMFQQETGDKSQIRKHKMYKKVGIASTTIKRIKKRVVN